MIMQRCDGRSLSQASGLTDERIVQTIGLLASLHECDAQPETRRSSRGIIRSIRRKAEQMEKLLPQHGDCVSKAVDAMEAARPRDSELVPSHGSFSPECVVATMDSLVFVDWSRFQWADACRDIASFGTATWKDSLMRGRIPDRALLKRAVAVYEAARPGAQIRKQLSFHVAANLLRLANILVESRAAEVYLVPALANLALREFE